MEPSFVGGVVDRMIRVPDAASVAATRHLFAATGRRAGGSTGTNLWGALQLASEMHSAGERGSIVTLLCDRGDRYDHSVYSDEWVADQGLDVDGYAARIEQILADRVWAP